MSSERTNNPAPTDDDGDDDADDGDGQSEDDLTSSPDDTAAATPRSTNEPNGAPSATETEPAGTGATDSRGSDPANSGGGATAGPGSSSAASDTDSGAVATVSSSPDDDAAGTGDSEDATAAEADESSGGPGGRLLDRVPQWVVPAAVVALVMAVPLYGMARAPGQPMEEGFMLVFPERLLAGDIPNRDFLHLYGPGSLWLLAGFFQVFGVDLWVERLVGFLQLAGLVAGVTFAGLRWGRWPALVGGAVAAIVIIPPTSLTALAWPGGVALALWAVLVAVRALDPDLATPGETGDGAPSSETSADVARNEPSVPKFRWAATTVERRRRRILVGAGLLAGVALLFRPDLVVALALPLGAMWLWGLDRTGRRHLATGVGIAVSPYLIHALLAGPGNAITGMVLEPVFELRPGRRLPFPPPWDEVTSFLNRAVVFRNWRWPFPALEESQQVFLWVPILFAVCAVLLAIGVSAYRSGSPQGWRLLTLALLSVGILPQVVQRADTAHLAWVSALPFGLLPLALTDWWRRRDGNRYVRAALPLVPVAILLAVIPHFTVRWYADYSGRTFGYRVDSWAIENRGRTFYYGRPDVAAAAEDMLADIEEQTEPGQRVIVGPGDFRRTPYSEAWIYFLLPQLEPGTRYIEMDPGIANADDSGLADELRDSDVVILSTTYDNWVEPNTSTEDGSDEPNQVLADEYCLHDTYGTSDFDPQRGFYELYLRC